MKFQINSFVFYCFVNFLCILLFLFLMYFFVFVIFYVSEVYLDKFQDKHDEAKGLEGTINSVIKQFRKSSILYTNVCKMLIFVQSWPDMRLHNVA